MPSEITDIKNFLEIARRKDAKGSFSPAGRYPPTTDVKMSETDCNSAQTSILLLTWCDTGARLKKSSKSKDIKLKIRCKRYLYTLILKDSDKADKIKQSLPPTMPFQEISKKNKKPKKA
ncbi:60S ribosomal protein L38 [Elasticomyces elasticus]|nr:60S ribosomal protein L38 [Elasticomyces elasticus]KAK5029074.1 60S ribosomal protein L38 [Exophiala sideris]KAK5178897.1 60S ribosomal protein L38 [Eurotiomycetes sp. CCFEE 6388]